MHSSYPDSTKNIWLRCWKQVLASTLFVQSLLEANLTVEGKNHICLKQKAGDGKTKHIWQAVCLTFFLNLSMWTETQQGSNIYFSLQAPSGCFHILTLQEQPSRIANVCSLFRSMYLFWHRRRWIITRMMALETFLSCYSPIQVPGQTVNK